MHENSFNFPFIPYPQQMILMEGLYSCVNNSKIGIFESPTGTGKSLSLLCSLLTWLFENEKIQAKKLEELNNLSKSTSTDLQELDWVTEFESKKKLDLEVVNELEYLNSLNDILNWIKNIKNGLKKDNTLIELNEISVYDKIGDENLIEYDEVDDLDDKETVKSGIVKIFYCSRTHSQLSQIVKELMKTSFSNKVVVSSLGSRQNLCINPKVKILKTINLINEKCLDLRKKSKESKSKNKSSDFCQFYSLKNINKVRESMVENPLDIEDLFKRGSTDTGCPFYASRQNLVSSHLVLMPYQNLLNPAARIASGVQLKGNIVVIDEAHNLADTVSAVNSVQLTVSHITLARIKLSKYRDRYLNKLSHNSLFYVNQLLSILRNLEDYVQLEAASNIEKGENDFYSLECVEFVFKCNLDKFDFHKILKFLNTSKIAFKLRGFLNSETSQTNDVEIPSKKRKFFESSENLMNNQPNYSLKNELDEVGNSMLVVKNFLEAIKFSLDGKILVYPGKELHFLVVDPGKYLIDIVKEVRSLIVIGGTMKPFSEFTCQLFGWCNTDRLQVLSCGHVVEAAKQLRVIPLVANKNNVKIKYTLENRTNSTFQNLGESIISLLDVCPNGAVIFVPSYEFLRLMLAAWKSSDMLVRITRIKRVFIEPKAALELESVIKGYSFAARTERGAILFAILGGKMSEGINFDDELCRLVIVVGVPYPNIKSATLVEKKRYIETNFGGVRAGKLMYENFAMKAVNQAIGRAIRHKFDYAAVVLMDYRYQSIVEYPDNGNQLGLPGWMKPGLIKNLNIETAIQELKCFYQSFIHIV